MTWKVPIPQDVYEWFGDDHLAANLFVRLLILARTTDMEKPSFYNKRPYQLKRGQVLFGRNAWARFLGASPMGASNALERVSRVSPVLATKVAGQFTIVSVQKYDEITSMVAGQLAPEVSFNCHPTSMQLAPDCHLTSTSLDIKKVRKKEGKKEETIVIAEKSANDDHQQQFQKVLDIWNEFAGSCGIKPILKLSEKRKSAILARSKESEFNLQSIFEEVRNSKFLRGENKNDWMVSFDFVFCSRNNYLKILEKKYRDKEGVSERTWDDVMDACEAIQGREENEK